MWNKSDSDLIRFKTGLPALKRKNFFNSVPVAITMTNSLNSDLF